MSSTHGRRETLLKETSGRCYYCGIGIDARSAIVEHVVPRSKGGSDRIANLTVSCESCNGKKGYFLIEELRSRILSKHPVFDVVFYFEKALLPVKGLYKKDH